MMRSKVSPRECMFCGYYTLKSFNKAGLARCSKCGQFNWLAPFSTEDERLWAESQEWRNDEDGVGIPGPAAIAIFAPLLGLSEEELVDHSGLNGNFVPLDDDHTQITVWVDRFLTTSEVAKILDVSVDWVGRMCSRGDFPNAKRAESSRGQRRGGRWLIPLSDLADLFTDQNMPASYISDQAGGLPTLEHFADQLVDLLIDFTELMGHSKLEGLVRPSWHIDQLIIANQRLAFLREAGMVKPDTRAFAVPSLKCTERSYLIFAGREEEDLVGGGVCFDMDVSHFDERHVGALRALLGMENCAAEFFTLKDEEVVRFFDMDPENIRRATSLNDVENGGELAELTKANLMGQETLEEGEPMVGIGYKLDGREEWLTPGFTTMKDIDTYVTSEKGRREINQRLRRIFGDHWNTTTRSWNISDRSTEKGEQ